jgi:hypothetical protein
MKLLPLGVWRTRDGNWERLTRLWIACIRLFRTETGVKSPPNADSLDGSLLEAASVSSMGQNTAELGKFTHCIVDAKASIGRVRD